MEKTKAFLEAHYKRYILTMLSLVPHVFSSLGLANRRSFSVLFRYEKTLCGFWCFIHPILRID